MPNIFSSSHDEGVLNMGRYVAYIGIKPAGDLGKTAFILGEVFGGISFQKDLDHQFEEYPAYIARSSDFEYVLLGIPDPEEDLREEPSDDFELQIHSDEKTPGGNTDISDLVVRKIEADGRLKSWILP